ncbi:MAG: hypothetical protein AABZ57_05645 [Candidatus Margulisiibacteriota bacterium]
MENFRQGDRSKKDLQFIVNEGIVYNKRDMMNLLWDLGYVIYFETERERILNKGKGFVMRVSVNKDDPTLFLNGRVYINVNSFDYLKMKKVRESLTLYELHSESRVMKIVPDTKKHAGPPFRYVTDAMVGLGVMPEELFPPEAFEEGPTDEISDEWWKTE